jgi:hypothetical protein
MQKIRKTFLCIPDELNKKINKLAKDRYNLKKQDMLLKLIEQGIEHERDLLEEECQEKKLTVAEMEKIKDNVGISEDPYKEYIQSIKKRQKRNYNYY